MTHTKARNVYEKMVRHYNRTTSPQKVCECGKVINENIEKSHLESKTHKFLMYHKQKALESEKKLEQGEQVELEEVVKPKHMSTWARVCDGPVEQQIREVSVPE